MRTLDFAERRSREYQLQSLDTDQSSFGWIWDSAFADWLSSSNPVFWLRGKPASGKSTLTQYLVHNDRTYSKLREYKTCEWLTIYFFFDFRGGKGVNNNFEGLLRSLLVQLLDAMPSLKEYTPSESSTYWHEAQLRECLLSVFDHSPKGLCLFIDGLDEYEGNLLQLLRFLTKLRTVGENSETPRKIYVSSRPEPIPSQLLEGTPSLSMSEENRRGIRAYVQSIMNDMPSKIAEDPQWRTLCDEIVNRADGVFLWARFALDELVQGFCKGESIDELSVRLESVPDELEGIYTRIIDRMEPQAKNEAFVMLQLSCFTLRSLLLQEFLVAVNLTMETESSIRKSIGRSELRIFSRRVPAKVGGLLEIIKVVNSNIADYELRYGGIEEDQNEDLEESLKILQVKLTHKTVKTFLDRCGWKLLQPQRQILPCNGDILLLKACSKYLKQFLDSSHFYGIESPVARYVSDRDGGPFPKTFYPFLAYSASALFCHAHRLEIVGNVSSRAYIKEVLTPKLVPIHVNVANVDLLYSACSCSFSNLRERYPFDVTSPFAHGLPKTCEEIICTHTGDENLSMEEALNEAILSSFWNDPNTNNLWYHLNTISLLLSKITQIKQSHLERAMAVTVPVHVLKLLLGHPSFENLQLLTDDGRRATLLWLLIYSNVYSDYVNLVAILRFIIEKGEDLNEPCGSYGTALDYAVRRGSDIHTAYIIEALVYCGAYKTVNPDSLLKTIKMWDSPGHWRDTTLRIYLAGQDGFDPGRVKPLKYLVERDLAQRAVMPSNRPSNPGEWRTEN